MTDEHRDPETGRFLPGNRFWEVRSTAGPKPKFSSANDLWAACCEYFTWTEDNPLYEAKAFAYEGRVTVESLPKMRAMTLKGLCMFLDISMSTWDEWRRSRPDLSEVITRAEDVLYRQKFEGASAGLLVANIIARDLGLAERQEHSGPDGKPIQTEDVSAREALADRIAGLAARKGKGGDTGEPD